LTCRIFNICNAVQGFAYKVVTTWHSLFDNIFNHYRPELYYMRGPGPKWHAKHDL
jgi:hypothetical protein